MPNNKINIILVIGYWLLVIGLCGCAKREIKNIDSKGTNIICFGDSVTFGYGVEAGGDYPTALAKLLPMPVINMGIDGDTSTEALKRLDSDVLDRNPCLVIIEFGGNDFLRKIPVEVTLKNTRKMIEHIQAKGAMAAIVDISAGMFLAQYRRGFLNLAREKGVIFIPGVFNGIITNPRLKSDFIHPNADGYRIIAQRINRVITPYLKENLFSKESAK